MNHTLKFIIIVNLVVFEVLEILQMQSLGFREYMKDIWNYIDQFSFITITTTLLLETFGAELHM